MFCEVFLFITVRLGNVERLGDFCEVGWYTRMWFGNSEISLMRFRDFWSGWRWLSKRVRLGNIERGLMSFCYFSINDGWVIMMKLGNVERFDDFLGGWVIYQGQQILINDWWGLVRLGDLLGWAWGMLREGWGNLEGESDIQGHLEWMIICHAYY